MYLVCLPSRPELTPSPCRALRGRFSVLSEAEGDGRSPRQSRTRQVDRPWE